MTNGSARRERSLGDLVATLLLIGFSVGAAVVLFFVSLMWAIGNHDNTVAIVSAQGVERWEQLSKGDVARKLADRIAQELS